MAVETKDVLEQEGVAIDQLIIDEKIATCTNPIGIRMIFEEVRYSSIADLFDVCAQLTVSNGSIHAPAGTHLFFHNESSGEIEVFRVIDPNFIFHTKSFKTTEARPELIEFTLDDGSKLTVFGVLKEKEERLKEEAGLPEPLSTAVHELRKDMNLPILTTDDGIDFGEIRNILNFGVVTPPIFEYTADVRYYISFIIGATCINIHNERIIELCSLGGYICEYINKPYNQMVCLDELDEGSEEFQIAIKKQQVRMTRAIRQMLRDAHQNPSLVKAAKRYASVNHKISRELFDQIKMENGILMVPKEFIPMIIALEMSTTSFDYFIYHDLVEFVPNSEDSEMMDDLLDPLNDEE